MQKIRFDELQAGDIILFHGAQVKVVTVDIAPADWDTAEKYVTFEAEPANAEALDIMGWFYSHGTYGGVGSRQTTLIERGA